MPDSRTWAGAPTGVDVVVTAAGGTVTLADRGPLPWVDLRLLVEQDAAGLLVRPVARLRRESSRPDTLAVTVFYNGRTSSVYERGDAGLLFEVGELALKIVQFLVQGI